MPDLFHFTGRRLPATDDLDLQRRQGAYVQIPLREGDGDARFGEPGVNVAPMRELRVDSLLRTPPTVVRPPQS